MQKLQHITEWAYRSRKPSSFASLIEEGYAHVLKPYIAADIAAMSELMTETARTPFLESDEGRPRKDAP